VIKLLSEADAQLICGGGLLDISILDRATFGNGNNVNLGYFPALTSQATTGGIAGSFNDNFRNNTTTFNPPLASGAGLPTGPSRPSGSGRPSGGWRS
jgi:hypothetical protein